MSEPDSVAASSFAELLGVEWHDDDPDHARASLVVRDDLKQPFGLLHGGVMSSLVESICSRSTALSVFGDGNAAMGQSIDVNLLRPVTEGSIEVTARARHRGRTTWVWEAEVTDTDGRLCALARVTIAVRPLPSR